MCAVRAGVPIEVQEIGRVKTVFLPIENTAEKFAVFSFLSPIFIDLFKAIEGLY